MSELILVKLAAINWSFHEQMDLPIHGTTAIVGDNGTGKSALLDMIQVVYAGGKPHGVKLNPGAQKNQKGGRTIGEYALGAVEEGRFLRGSATTYICLGFEGDNRRYTIGLVITAQAAAASTHYDIEDRFIAPGVLLDSGDFLDGAGAPRPWAAQKAVLETMCKDHLGPGKRRGLACYPRNSHEYLFDHLSLASEGRFGHEPGDLLRAMSNALAFKEQIDSAGMFVKTFLLNAEPIDVNRIRRSASDYQHINKDIVRLEAELELVKQMRTVASDYLRAIELRELARAGRSRAEAIHALTSLRDQRLTLKQKSDSLRADQTEVEAYKGLIEEADAELERLQTLRSHSSAAGRVSAAKSAHQALTARRDAIEVAVEAFGALRQAAIELKPVVTLANLPGAAEIQTVATLSKDPTDDPTLAGLAILELGNVLEKLARALEKLDLDLTEKSAAARREAEEKQHAAEVAVRTGRNISPAADDLVRELKARGMNPRLLCSIIEVTDASWRDAAEARLGRDREAVIVDPQHCREAILYYRDNRNRFQRDCSVANTAKEGYLDAGADKGSLAGVIATKDPLARAFIDRRFGRIRLAMKQSELELPGSAIMQDCTYDDGLVVRTLELRSHKIGAAGANATSRLAADAETAHKLADSTKRESNMVRAAATRLPEIARIVGSGFDVTSQAEALIDIKDKIEESARSIARLEQEGDKELMAEIERAKKAANSRREELAALTLQINSTKIEIGKATAIINSPDVTEPGSIAMARAAHAQHQKDRRSAAWYRFHPYFAELMKSAGTYRSAIERANRRYNDNEKLQGERLLEFQDLLNKHKQSHDAARDFSRDDSISGTLLPWIESRIASIENTDLISRRHDLIEAFNQIRRFLQEDFIHRIADRAKMVKNTIRAINRVLENYEFHRETYSFTAELDPHYEPIVRFAERANTDETFIDQIIMGKGQASDRDVLEQIHGLVLGDDETQPKDEEIDKLADYRNWFKYGLVMTNTNTGNMTRFDHRMAKGSGGEIQAPFYVIMAVSIAAIHHGRAGTRRHIGPVLLDEAFSKLSPKNAKSCIDFFSTVGLQVIMAAPGGKRAVIDASCNSVIDLLRVDDQVYIDTEIIGQKLHEETIAADPDHYSIDDLRRFIAQDPKQATDLQAPANTEDEAADIAAE